MDINSMVYPFNNSIETGLRSLCLLTSAYPRSFDLETVVCLDYICVHTGDFEPSEKSLHPNNPNRHGELFVRRGIIELGLEVFINKGLVSKLYLVTGIEYSATEMSASFLDSVNARYTLDLIERSDWVTRFIKDKNNDQIHQLLKVEASNYRFQILSK